MALSLTSSAVVESSPVVGSSRKSTGQSCRISTAMESRRDWLNDRPRPFTRQEEQSTPCVTGQARRDAGRQGRRLEAGNHWRGVCMTGVELADVRVLYLALADRDVGDGRQPHHLHHVICPLLPLLPLARSHRQTADTPSTASVVVPRGIDTSSLQLLRSPSRFLSLSQLPLSLSPSGSASRSASAWPRTAASPAPDPHP